MRYGNIVRQSAWVAWAGWLVAVPVANAQPRDAMARGELLYNTHCVACHTAQIHWRGKVLVADWDSLRAQVRRWQDTAALNWSEDEITSVALYLNRLHYGYPVDLYGRAPDPAIHQGTAKR